MRKHGLSIDNLLSIDLVTATGEFVRASADENADLFWGVRGGGGTGIATEFEFRCVSLDSTSLPDRCSGRWRSRQRFCASIATGSPRAPDELMTIVVHRKAPLPFVPVELHGERVDDHLLLGGRPGEG